MAEVGVGFELKVPVRKRLSSYTTDSGKYALPADVLDEIEQLTNPGLAAVYKQPRRE